MDLFEQVSNDIKEAMKARDKVRLMTLRNIKKVFLEAKTAPGANDTLDDAAALKILQKLAKQGRETAATYTANGRADLAEEELAQAAVRDRRDSQGHHSRDRSLIDEGYGARHGHRHQAVGWQGRRRSSFADCKATAGIGSRYTLLYI